MTGSANCDVVSKGRRDLCGAKYIGVYWNLRFICNLVLGICDFGMQISNCCFAMWGVRFRIVGFLLFDEQKIEGPRMFEMPRGNAAERTTTPE